MFVRLMFAALAFVLVLAAVGCNGDPSEPRVIAPEPTGTTEAPVVDERAVIPLDEIEITLREVASGFDQPLFVTSDGTGSGVLYVLEKTGRIWTLDNGVRGEAPFLDISDRVSTTSEQGLLGIAFPPNYAETQMFLVSYTRADGASVLSWMRGAPRGQADPGSEQVLLTQPQPFVNHNGGMIAFGPDGHLYYGLGDGGSGGDPQGNGQNLGTLLGKMLRLNVLADASQTRETPYGIPLDNPFASQEGARGEIWAYGLRNPWRFSFDRATGDLWIGDVGQNNWEEIDFQPASSTGGENYGWNLYEGAHTYPRNEAVSGPVEGFAMPLVEYDRQAGKSVTGGYVYRGAEQDRLWGTYFYADYVDGRIWGLQRAEDGTVQTRLLLDTQLSIASFGEDDSGELYVVDFGGSVHRLVQP